MRARTLADYSDLLELPHPVSRSHPQMSLYDRAAQFSPFAALTGYGAAISETARLTDERPQLDESEQELLNERLLSLQRELQQPQEERSVVTVTYFMADARKDGGSLQQLTGTIQKIDVYQQIVTLLTDAAMIPVSVPIADLIWIEL